jgi:hypothetical protein
MKQTGIVFHLCIFKIQDVVMELLCRVDVVTDLINALPGNSSVNTVKHATIDEDVFSMLSAPRSSLLTDQSTRSLTRNVFSLWSVPRKHRSAVFSVRGPCREDMREYRNGN